MALDFNGTTSLLTNNIADLSNGGVDMTFVAWFLADTAGELSSGILVCSPETGLGWACRYNSDNIVHFRANIWSATDGVWSFTASMGVWHSLSISYNRTGTAADPAIRLDFVDVVPTVVSRPVGIGVGAAGTGVAVGNTINLNQTFNGAIDYVQIFDRILTVQEQDSALRYPYSIRSGLRFAPLMLSPTNLFDLSGNGFHATASSTALALRSGPPAVPFWMMQQEDDEFVSAAAAVLIQRFRAMMNVGR
ncbi:MAG: LamG-like jellyroll fold domain-containing protein [Nitrososphaera sp.]